MVKDVKFILSLIPDLPQEFVDIRTFAAFPETYTNEFFCQGCAKHILSKEDFDLGTDHLAERLSLVDPILNEQNEKLLLEVSARTEMTMGFVWIITRHAYNVCP